jgi:hypothetical protein
MQVHKAQTMVRGKSVTVDSFRIDNKKIVCFGKFFKMARMEEEWYEDVEDPESIIDALKKAHSKPDIFTFWQRMPETSPKYNYYMEPECIAALPIKGFDYWYKKQIDTNARRAIKKAEKNGVIVKLVEFDDEFVRGMINIFNETPVRQGKPFWHYGKDFETVKGEFSRYLYRENLIGAYYNGELIGFMFLANARNYALPGQIISKVEHRDKATNNALIAKAVKICEEKNIPYFVYFNWGDGTLAEFKRRNGFERVTLPRYYIALTRWGKIILKLHLQHGFVGILPISAVIRLKSLRSIFYDVIFRRIKAATV